MVFQAPRGRTRRNGRQHELPTLEFHLQPEPAGMPYGVLDDGRAILELTCEAAHSSQPRKLTRTHDDRKDAVSLREKCRRGRR